MYTESGKIRLRGGGKQNYTNRCNSSNTNISEQHCSQLDCHPRLIYMNMYMKILNQSIQNYKPTTTMT